MGLEHIKLNRLKPFLIIALVTAASELLLFNYRSIMSCANHEVKPDTYTTGGGLVREGDNRYRITNGEGEGYIEIRGINEHISNIHIDAEIVDADGYYEANVYNSCFDDVSINIYADDEANSQYLGLGRRSILHRLPESQYMVTHLSGKTVNIKIHFNEKADTVIELHDVSYNARIPLNISFLRMAAVFMLLLILYLLRPSSGAYRIVYDEGNVKQTLVKLVAAVAVIMIYYVLCSANPYFEDPIWAHHYQYQDLAHSIADGSVSLPDETDEALASMNNPYDTALRNSLGISYKWDTAYYDGKYYVYFGILPELVFYLPFYLITGQDFPTNLAVYITGVLLITGFFRLFSAIVKRWFPKTPFILYMLAVIMACTGCGALYIMIRPDFYSLPIIMAVTLSVWGLSMWISSSDGEKLSKPMLAAGSTCMALVAASRPQLLIVSFVAIPLFFDEVFRRKVLILGKKAGNTIAFLLPYVIVAAGVMYYNYIRFGSPVDFGANYNLTTNDMTHRGFVAGRTFLGVFYFLFQTPQTSAVFPFFNSVSVNTSYLGRTITQTMYGGIIACNVWLMPVIAAFAGRSRMWSSKKARNVALALLLSTIVIVIADTQMAGILARYVSDFGWILFTGAGITAFSLYGYVREHRSAGAVRAFKIFLMVAFVQGMFYNCMRIFMSDTESIIESNPYFYYKIMHLVAFWT